MLRPAQRYAATIALLLFARAALAQDVPAPKLTKPPKMIHFVEAPFPEMEKAVGKPASVTLKLTISEKGVVTAAEVTISAGPGFDAAAVAAAKQFVFDPAEIDNKPSPIRILFKYDFTLTEAKPVVARFAGKVRDRVKHLPVPAVVIEVDGAGKATTGKDGAFDIANIPPGTRGVMLSGAGLTSVRTQETFVAGERLEVAYDVSLPEPAATPGESDDLEIVVTAPPVQRQVVSTSIASDQAAKIPGAAGDVLKVVDSMPGVARASAGSAALIVWGAAPGDTKTYIDGVPIPQLYHQGGLRSVVSSDLVRNVELVPGGYGASYGGGLGGIVVVDTKPLENDGAHATVSADLFEAAASAHASLTDKLRVEAAGEYSYLDQLADKFVSPQVEEFFPFPKFHDAQARIHYQLAPRDSIELVFLMSGDSTSSGIPNTDPTLSVLDTVDQSFYRVYLRYRSEGANGSTVTITPYIGFDQNNLNDSVGGISTFVKNNTTLGGLRANWRGLVTPWLTAEGGLDASISSAALQRQGSDENPPREGDPYVFGQPPPGQLNADSWNTVYVDVAPYAQFDFALFSKTLHVDPGLRMDPYVRSVSRSFPANGNTPAVGLFEHNLALEPRLSINLEATHRLNFHGAIGQYHQQPAPEDLSSVFGNPTLPTSMATQALVGGGVKITEKLSAEVTGFWTESSQLAVRSPLPSPAVAQALVDEGAGRAYGGQIVLKQEKIGPIFGWVSYTLSRSERQDTPGGAWRLSDYDQTHLLTAVADYDVGWGIDIGLRVRYASGFPRTPVAGSYLDTQNDQMEPVFGSVNTIRIPAFFQMDLRAAKDWKIGKSKLTISLDIQNVTNQANPEEIVYSSDFTRKSYITGLPILPVLGLRWSI